MKANLIQISTLVLLISLFLGCTESVPEKDPAFKSDKVTHSYNMLVGEIDGDQIKPIMTDQALIESLFREAYPYASDNLSISKQPQGTYQPFQIEHDTLNRHHKQTYYLTALASDRLSQKPVFLRLELTRERNSLFLNPEEGTVLHIHNCIDKPKSDGTRCNEFLFTAQGFYNGCDCGDKVKLIFSRDQDH